MIKDNKAQRLRNTLSQKFRYPNFRLEPKHLNNKSQTIVANPQWNRTITDQFRNKCLSQYPQHFSLSIQPRIKTQQSTASNTFLLPKQRSSIIVPTEKTYESLFHKNTKMSFKKMSQIKQNLVDLGHEKTTEQAKTIKQKLFINNSLVYSSLQKTKSDKKNFNDTAIKKIHFQTLEAKKNRYRYLIRKVNHTEVDQDTIKFQFMKKSVSFAESLQYSQELKMKVKQLRYQKIMNKKLGRYHQIVQKKPELSPWDSAQEDIQMYPKPYAQQVGSYNLKSLIKN